MSSKTAEARPIEAWEVPIATRQTATKAVGLVCEQLGLTGMYVRWYTSAEPNGGPPDAGDPPGVWLRVTKNPAELTYEAAYQCRRFWLARHSATAAPQADAEAATWAAAFVRRLMTGELG